MERLAAASNMRDAFAILNKMRDDGVIEKYAVGGAVATSAGARKEGQYVVFAGWPLQFLPADISPLVAEALSGAVEFEADGLSVWVFGPEHLAAIALEVGRPTRTSSACTRS